MTTKDVMWLVTGLGKAARLLLSNAEGSLTVGAVAPGFPPRTSKGELNRIAAHCRVHVETESIKTLLSLDSALPNSNNSSCSLTRARTVEHTVRVENEYQGIRAVEEVM